MLKKPYDLSKLVQSDSFSEQLFWQAPFSLRFWYKKFRPIIEKLRDAGLCDQACEQHLYQLKSYEECQDWLYDKFAKEIKEIEAEEYKHALSIIKSIFCCLFREVDECYIVIGDFTGWKPGVVNEENREDYCFDMFLNHHVARIEKFLRPNTQRIIDCDKVPAPYLKESYDHEIDYQSYSETWWRVPIQTVLNSQLLDEILEWPNGATFYFINPRTDTVFYIMDDEFLDVIGKDKKHLKGLADEFSFVLSTLPEHRKKMESVIADLESAP